ncbi:MAG: ankyrin repeat domain-containing protein, partial [Myxococcota bacterium]
NNRGVIRNASKREALLQRAGMLAARDPYQAAHLSVDGRQSAMRFCCLNGLDRLVERFVEAGVDVNGESTAENGQILLSAVQRGTLACVQLLLGHGADPNLRSLASGHFPLLAAARRGDAAFVGALLDAGADPLLKTQGSTTSINAARGPDRNAIRRLLREAARPRVEKSRRSALKFRRRKKMYDLEGLVGASEFDAYYPAPIFGVVSAPLLEVVGALEHTCSVEARFPAMGGRTVAAREHSFFLFATANRSDYTFFADAMLGPGRLQASVTRVAAHLQRPHLLRRFRREYRSERPGPGHPETQFFNHSKLWVPPFYVSGEGQYDSGERHLLEFKGITREAIHAAEYVVLAPETLDERKLRQGASNKSRAASAASGTSRFSQALAKATVEQHGAPPLGRIEVVQAPTKLSLDAEHAASQARELGCSFLAWLEAEVLGTFWIAGFRSGDGLSAICVTGSAVTPFSPLAVDSISRFDDGRVLTTTTLYHAPTYEDKGLLTFAEGPLSVGELHERHRAHAAALGGALSPAPATAEELVAWIRAILERQRSA